MLFVPKTCAYLCLNPDKINEGYKELEYKYETTTEITY